MQSIPYYVFGFALDKSLPTSILDECGQAFAMCHMTQRVVGVNRTTAQVFTHEAHE